MRTLTDTENLLAATVAANLKTGQFVPVPTGGLVLLVPGWRDVWRAEDALSAALASLGKDHPDARKIHVRVVDK